MPNISSTELLVDRMRRAGVEDDAVIALVQAAGRAKEQVCDRYAHTGLRHQYDPHCPSVTCQIQTALARLEVKYKNM